jgi:hypothetical protein
LRLHSVYVRISVQSTRAIAGIRIDEGDEPRNVDRNCQSAGHRVDRLSGRLPKPCASEITPGRSISSTSLTASVKPNLHEILMPGQFAATLLVTQHVASDCIVK